MKKNAGTYNITINGLFDDNLLFVNNNMKCSKKTVVKQAPKTAVFIQKSTIVDESDEKTIKSPNAHTAKENIKR
jgi:hypothetical protein